MGEEEGGDRSRITTADLHVQRGDGSVLLFIEKKRRRGVAGE